MTNKHLVQEEEFVAFNRTREQQVGKTFNRTEIVETLGKLGYSQNAQMLVAMTSGVNPPILKVSRGKYAFNPKPVYKDRLQTAWNTYTHINKRNHDQAVPSIKQAIEVLKKAGYKVLKPITQYEEI